MSVYLSPLGNDQQLDSNGNPLVGGYWEVYAAGTTTPVTTYTSSDGLTPQAAQIVLDAAGRPANPIWLTGGASVKFRLYSAAAVLLLTIDNVSGINDPSGSAVTLSEWLASGFTPTYIGATSFSVPGDQTASLQIGRRVRTTNTGGTVYSTITNSVFGALTTVTVENDSGTLDSGLSVLAYGILAPTSPSAPALGQSQVWSEPTRAIATVYTNTTGRPIFVNAAISSTVAFFPTLTIGGVAACIGGNSAPPSFSSVSGIVPPGLTYSITVSAGTGSIAAWAELR